MTITVDIAALVSAVLWPVAILVILLMYRDKLPGLVQGFANRISKLEFAGFSLQIAKATEFVPEWTESLGAIDLRQKATAVQVNDSTARTFALQLTESGSADYAEVNLGTGGEWLTSRLYIMAIVFARVKEIKCFVFVETSGNVRRRYVGWAQPDKIRWALARRYPWLERAYAEAYSVTINSQQAFVVTNYGRLGNQFSKADPGPSIQLLREFLERVQVTNAPQPPAGPEQWVLIDPATSTYEHASWIQSEELESILADDLNRSTFPSSALRSENNRQQLRAFLSVPGRFQAVVEDERRFEYLVDRDVLLEQLAQLILAEGNSPIGKSGFD